MAPLLSVLSLWRGKAGPLILGLCVSLLAVICGLALLSAAGLRLAGTAVGLLLIPAILLRALGVGRVLLRYAERLLTHGAMFRALADLRVWFFRRLAGSAAGGLGFRRTGDVLSRLVGDVEALDGLYLRLLLPLCGALLTLPVLALLLGRIQIALAVVVCLLFLATSLLLPWLAARGTARAGATLSQAASGLRVAVLDMVGGLREIRAYDAGDRAMALVAGAEARLLSAQSYLVRQGALAGAGAFLCGQAAMLCVLAASMGFVFARIGAMPAVLCLFLLLAAFEAASGLVRAGVLAGHMAHSASRVLEAGDRHDAVRLADAARPKVTKPVLAASHDLTLRFESVCFGWPGRAAIFENLSLDIPHGARIALLGPSGAGKSTLAALLLRVARPQSGHVAIGGVDLAVLDEAALRGRVAWLGQTSHLFDDSIRNNLLLGRPDADEAALWSALEQAQIADLVRSLPDGLDSWLGELGAKVSGGQGRRLALARVLLSNAPILILDEPCAGLDADTERQFLMTLNSVAVGRTIILIVHRLMGVERLDRIWRLADGRISTAA